MGGTAATSANVTSAASLTAVTPAGTAGAADVSVTTSAGTATRTGGFTCVKAAATGTFGNLTQTYDGTAKSATATPPPAGLMVTLTYDGSATAPTNAGSCAVVAAVIVSDPAPTFTDHPLVVRSTSSKAVHIAELRAAVNALRARYSLPAATWADATLTTGETTVKAVHLTELRTALNAVYVAAGRTPPTCTDATIVAGTTAIAIWQGARRAGLKPRRDGGPEGPP